jgi:HEAT repeat protein
VLIQSLESKDSRARQWAVFALGNLGPAAQPATAALRKRLNDEDPAVRQLTEAVLVRLQADN